MFLRSLQLTAVIVLSSFAETAALPISDASPYLRAQRLVDIGGRRMNLYCTGTGSPTVILGTDVKIGTPAWRLVQSHVAKHTRVCSYDSAGVGFSDPVKTPLDANSAVSDLHRLLSRAGIAGPLVMVGYQDSALYSRLYADRYTSDVAGMVLVAPNVPNQTKRVAQIVPTLAPVFASVDQFDRQCTAAAQRGELHPGTGAFSNCLYPLSDITMPVALKKLTERERERVSWWQDYSSIDRSQTSSSAQVLREQRDYGAMPLIVLTGTGDIDILPLPRPQRAALADAMITWNGELAKLSHRGAAFVVDGSTQDIPVDRPVSVVSAIDEVVDQARAPR